MENQDFEVKLRAEVRKVLRRLNSRAERIQSVLLSVKYGDGDNEVLGAGTNINSATHLVYLLTAVANELGIEPTELCRVVGQVMQMSPDPMVKVPILELIQGGKDEEAGPE